MLEEKINHKHIYRTCIDARDVNGNKLVYHTFDTPYPVNYNQDDVLKFRLTVPNGHEERWDVNPIFITGKIINIIKEYCCRYPDYDDVEENIIQHFVINHLDLIAVDERNIEGIKLKKLEVKDQKIIKDITEIAKSGVGKDEFVRKIMKARNITVQEIPQGTEQNTFGKDYKSVTDLTKIRTKRKYTKKSEFWKNPVRNRRK